MKHQGVPVVEYQVVPVAVNQASGATGVNYVRMYVCLYLDVIYWLLFCVGRLCVSLNRCYAPLWLVM